MAGACHFLKAGNAVILRGGSEPIHSNQALADCIIAAGALVTQGAVIPDGSMVMGAPGKVRRPLTPEEIASNAAAAADYRRESQLYKAGEL